MLEGQQGSPHGQSGRGGERGEAVGNKDRGGKKWRKKLYLEETSGGLQF